mgnify:FL=1
MPRLVSLCLITGAATLAVTACTPFDREAVRGSGEVTTRDYDVSDFDRIRVGRALDIEIVPGDTHSVELIADDNIMRYITVDQRGDTLVLDVDDDVSLRRVTHRFEIAVPELERVELHGASKANVTATRQLEAELSGFSKLRYSGDPSLGRIETSGGSNVAPA